MQWKILQLNIFAPVGAEFKGGSIYGEDKIQIILRIDPASRDLVDSGYPSS